MSAEEIEKADLLLSLYFGLCGTLYGVISSRRVSESKGGRDIQRDREIQR
jgi:hypothetical protein